MLWTADTLMYRGVSMDAAYSGDTLIWTRYRAELVTSTTQINSTSTYVFGYPISAGTAYVGLKRGLTNNCISSRMYITTSSTSNNNELLILPDKPFKLKLEKRTSGTGDWYKITDSICDYLITCDSPDSAVTEPYIYNGINQYFELTNSVDYRNTHVTDLQGYTFRQVLSDSGDTMYKYLAKTSSPDRLSYKEVNSGQDVAMLYAIQYGQVSTSVTLTYVMSSNSIVPNNDYVIAYDGGSNIFTYVGYDTIHSAYTLTSLFDEAIKFRSTNTISPEGSNGINLMKAFGMVRGEETDTSGVYHYFDINSNTGVKASLRTITSGGVTYSSIISANGNYGLGYRYNSTSHTYTFAYKLIGSHENNWRYMKLYRCTYHY